jgi:hypothetical protein
MELLNMNPFNILNWPKMDKWGRTENYPVEAGTNVINIRIFGRFTGLTYFKDNKQISVSLDHPMANYWLSILKPMWEKQNKGKCKTCNGTGWDGIGYILTCVDCGGTGKDK